MAHLKIVKTVNLIVIELGLADYHSKSIPERERERERERDKCWQKGKSFIIRMPAIWGDGGLSVPQKPCLKILLSYESF